MADQPDVLKRLEEIERLTDPASPDDTPFDDEVRWLLALTRALLESQGELLDMSIDAHSWRCSIDGCYKCKIMRRAEQVRNGEV